MRAIIHDNEQRQRLTGTALGRRLVMYRSTLGVAKTGRRFAGQGCLLPVLTGRGLTSPGIFSGVGKRSTAPLASIIHETADHLLHYRAKPLERHFQNLRFDRSNPIPGAKIEVTHHQSIWYPHDR